MQIYYSFEIWTYIGIGLNLNLTHLDETGSIILN